MSRIWRNARAWAMHSPDDLSREVNYMGIQNRHGFQGYNQGGPTGYSQGPLGFNQGRMFTQGSSWRNHPGNQYNKEPKNQPPYQHPSQETSHHKPTNLEELLIQFMQKTESHQKSTDVAIRNLEMQISQLAQDKVERPNRTFRANTEKSQGRVQGGANQKSEESRRGGRRKRRPV